MCGGNSTQPTNLPCPGQPGVSPTVDFLYRRDTHSPVCSGSPVVKLFSYCQKEIQYKFPPSRPASHPQAYAFPMVCSPVAGIKSSQLLRGIDNTHQCKAETVGKKKPSPRPLSPGAQSSVCFVGGFLLLWFVRNSWCWISKDLSN